MKKIIITLLLTSMFQLQDSRVINNEPEINILNEIAVEMNLQLQVWQDIYIEEVDLNDFREMKSLLLKDYTEHIVETNQLSKSIFTPKTTQNNTVITHEIHTSMMKRKDQNVKIQIIMTGDKWNEEVNENYINMTKLLKEKYKLKLESNFACAKLNDSGIINNGILINNVIEKLHPIHIDEQKDNVADSIYEQNVYGQSPLFDQEINVNEQEINFQVVIRQTESKEKQVILGTPIILNEY